MDGTDPVFKTPRDCRRSWHFQGACLFLGIGILSLVAAGKVLAAEPQTLAVAPTEHVATVTDSEAAGYYEAVVEALGKLGELAELKVLERDKLKGVLDEQDIALAFGPEAADNQYASAAKSLAAELLVVPTISKLENDYLLCLRLISVSSGATKSCSVHRTRLLAKFPDHAKRQVQELLGELAAKKGESPSDPEQTPVSLEQLRQACLQAGADRLFPALWKRCEELRDSSDSATPPRLAHYYMALLNLCARASAPPEGMVFVPGGYVSINTSEGTRRLWVEPFFIDRCEVTVLQYERFLQGTSGPGGGPGRMFLPVTRNDKDFNVPDFPVTGATYVAASAYAKSQGKVLPTMPQWMRAACGDDERDYPCGGEDQLAGCCLKGNRPAAKPLVPADTLGDESPFGVLHMTGNAREWTRTWYDKHAYAHTPADRPEEPAQGLMRIVKGGSWRTDPTGATCQAFEQLKPTEAFDDVGFRCALPFFLSDAPVDRPVLKTISEETRNAQ